MTTLPPTIDSNALPSTPANEWANHTATALGSDTNTHANASTNATQTTPHDKALPRFASAASTPGYDFPGAFPRENNPTSESALSAAGAKDTALGVLDTAKQYIPAQRDVENAFYNAGETAKQYLPQAVTSYFPGLNNTQTISLPSSEVAGSEAGSSAGAGPLPGPLSETSVAKLPEERAREGTLDGTSTQPPITTTTNKHLDTSQLASNINGYSDATTPLSNFSTQAQAGSEGSGTSPHTTPSAAAVALPGSTTGGVGDLPGHRFETGVAVLPHEHATSNSKTTGGVGDLPGTPSESGVALLPEERAGPRSSGVQPRPETKGEKMKQGGEKVKDKVTGAISGHKPTTTTSNSNVDSTTADQGHSPNERLSDVPSHTFSSTNTTSTNGSKFKETVISSETSRGSESSGGSNGSTHKATLMDKIKGEAKVISGKLGKNEGKVEEGRRMMGKA